MVRELLIKWCLCRTYVYFWRGGAAEFHTRFVDIATSEALSVKGAMVGLSVIAVSKLVIVLMPCPTYTGVVELNNILPILGMQL